MARVKSIEEQLAEMLRPENLSKTGKIDGVPIEQILVKEANRLKEILAKYIRSYYDSYPEPNVYIRWSQYSMVKALRVETSASDNKIAIYFDEDMVWGESVIDPWKWGYGFEPILMDTGWRVNPSAPHANIYRFGYYEGYHFIDKAVREFKQTNKYGLLVEVKVDPGANAEFGKKFRLTSIARNTYDKIGIW